MWYVLYMMLSTYIKSPFMGNDSSLENEYLFKICDKLDFCMVLSIANPSTLLADRLRCDLNSPIFMFINGLRS